MDAHESTNTPPAPGTTNRAAGALDQGQLLVFPTETVYGVFARSDIDGASERLAGHGTVAAWHAASPEEVAEVFALTSGAHRRLLGLTPGPLTLQIEREPEEIESLLPGAARWMNHDPSRLAVRIPGNAELREVLAAVDGPVVGRAVLTPDGHPVRSLAGIDLASNAWRDAEVIDDGPCAYGRSSTHVRLSPDGGWVFEREGVLEERYIRSQMVHRVVFVCTGNTCRSPMAERIARSILPSEAGGLRVEVSSAGVAAGTGQPATPEGDDALRGMGIEVTPHRSRPMTDEILRSSDVVIGLTKAHVASIGLEGSRARVLLLDPDGADVQDPIGGPASLYNETAERLRELIERRIASGDLLPA